jgi:hypothetical protein
MAARQKFGTKEYRLLRRLRPLVLRVSAKAKKPLLAPAELRACKRWGWEDNIYGIFVGEKQSAGSRVPGQACITFVVDRKISEHRLPGNMRIPKTLEWDSIGKSILTDVVCTRRRMQTQSFRASDEVGHVLAGQGTASLIVVNSTGQRCGLSCSHVVARHGFASAGEIVESPPNLNTPLPINEIGRLLPGFSILSDSNPSDTDAALFTIPENSDPVIPGIGRPSGLSNLDGSSLGSSRIDVIRNGRGSGGLRTGSVTGHRGTIRLSDDVLGEVVYEDAVLYATENARGDSGAAVFELGSTTVVGMHVGGDPDSERAVFLPISHVVDRFGLSLP